MLKSNEDIVGFFIEQFRQLGKVNRVVELAAWLQRQWGVDLTIYCCSDSRVLILAALGLVNDPSVRVIRDVGADFTLGHPHICCERLEKRIVFSVKHGKTHLIIIVWHRSKTSNMLGCAGHKFNDANAEAAAWAFHDDINRVWGNRRVDGYRVVYPIVAMYETDEGSLTFASEKSDGESLHLPLLVNQVIAILDQEYVTEEDRIRAFEGFETAIRAFFLKNHPDMHPNARHRMMPLCATNIGYVASMREQSRVAADLEHQEVGVAIGDVGGIDRALLGIINDASKRLKQSSMKFFRLVEENFREGRVKGRPIFIISIPFDLHGHDKERSQEDREKAFLRARDLSLESVSWLIEACPDPKVFESFELLFGIRQRDGGFIQLPELEEAFRSKLKVHASAVRNLPLRVTRLE